MDELLMNVGERKNEVTMKALRYHNSVVLLIVLINFS